MWTAVLLVVGIGSLLLSARLWWGWLLGGAGEFVWAAYALKTHDHALFVMSWVWMAAYLYNAVITYRREHASSQEEG